MTRVSRLVDIMDENTLGEWSDSDDEWIWDVDENALGESSDSDDEWIWDVDENALGEWSDSDHDWIWDVDESALREWSDPEADDIIRNVNVQTGRGEKRKSAEPLLQEKDFYEKESVTKHMSKKFRMTATDHTIRFNNVLNELDLIKSYERTQTIFEHILNDVTQNMNEKDQVRFVLRSEQLDTPISMPFMPVEQLTPEKVFSQIERVIQSNRDFRLNDTVTVDIIHVEAPQGSGRSKRTTLNISEYLHKKGSVVSIQNNDNLCLARALVVAVAKIENDPNYVHLVQRGRRAQEKKAIELHETANVPFGPCGLPEVDLFQKYLTNYEINIVSGNHNNSIIYPPKPSTNNVTPIYLYLHDNHYDVITSMPGFLSTSYFCHKCSKSYSNNSDHLCDAMCRSCRSYGCVIDGNGMVCNECERWFKSKDCYDHHKENVDGTRSVCQVIRKCEKCGKSMDVRKLNPKNHICGKKCPTCGLVLDEKSEHQCYIQKTEQPEESQYNQLLFFDLECKQEHGVHEVNLCIVQDEEGKEKLFQGSDTVKDFCEWLLTKEHQDCIVVAHNFQGYDGYFIQNYLNKNAIKYEVILRGAKILSMTIPMFNIKFIDSLNFIPMSLANFPKTFGETELCKGYFPHLFNKEENQDYVGPIPCQNDYGVNFMKPEVRKAFLAWHKEQVESNYVFDFQKEIVKYCRSDVDILRKCCMSFREMLRDKTDIDPFEKCLTIASYCHEVYRTNFLKKDTIAVFQHDRQLKTKQSNMAVKWLSYEIERNDIHIQHVRNGGEKRVGRYSLDGYCEERNTAYEFQGCFWHGKLCKVILKIEKILILFPCIGCPKCYTRETVNPVNGKTMEQLYGDTFKKVRHLKDQDFNVIEKWECELVKEMEHDEDLRRYFEEYEMIDPLQPRDAFYGGRTNAAKLLHECQDDEEIR